MENKTLPEVTPPTKKAGKSFVSMFKGLFSRNREQLSVLEEEALQTPTQTVIKNFLRNKLGIIGVIGFILILAFSFVGSQVRPIFMSYIEPVMSNIGPSNNFLKVPSQLVEEGVETISSGISFSAALSKEGKVFVWGRQPVYLLEGVSTSILKIPEGVKNSKITHLAAGDRHIIALDANNNLYGWGYNNFKQCELPANAAAKIRKTKVVDLLAGESVSGILFADGELIVWGSTMATNLNIIPVGYQGRIIKADLGPLNGVVLLDDGTVGVFGVMGNEVSTVPEQLQDGSVKIVDITASARGAIALDDTGEVHIWGAKMYGLMDTPEHEGKVVAVAAGKNNHALLLDTGEVLYWGANHYGQINMPKGMEKEHYVALYANFFQNYAVTKDGSVTAWGNRGFIFGTDQHGRDNFTRLIHGGRISLTVGAIAMVIATIIALIIGMTSGFFGGWLDNVLMRATDVIISIPFMPLAITLSAIVFGKVTEMYRIYMIMVILGLLSWPGLARLIRAQILLEREKDFVLAAKALGVKQRHIIIRHIMPNIFNLVLVSITLGYASSLLTDAGLSFLGFGVTVPTPSWGNMLTGAQSSMVIKHYWWRWLIPGLFVVLAALSINLVGDALRDAMDPKATER